jgi:hypothetical protein
MGISLWVGTKDHEIGTSSFFNSFFSTVFVKLENEKWGSRFPAIMGELYSGRLKAEHAGGALQELKTIRDRLEGFSPEEFVWDHENRDASPPWGRDTSPKITTLADYFITSDGRNLLDVLEEAIRLAESGNRDLSIS